MDKVTKESNDQEDGEKVLSNMETTAKDEPLTVNDNINYHLYYESGCSSKADTNAVNQKESSLSSGSSIRSKGLTKHYKKNKASAFLNSFNKPSGFDSSFESDEPRYQRFSPNRRCSWLPSVTRMGFAIILTCSLCILGAFGWLYVTSALNDTWSEEHYRRLWQQAHPPMPQAPDSFYHDHNNLSTKNRINATENAKLRRIEKMKNIKNTLTPVKEAQQCGYIPDTSRFDCFPQTGATAEGCQARGCCWALPSGRDNPQNIPYCYYPSNYRTFKIVNYTTTIHGAEILYQKVMDSTYPNDFNLVKINIKYFSNNVLNIKIFDPENDRFEPPYPQIANVPSSLDKPNFELQIDQQHNGFRIIRKDDGTVIFDGTDVDGMIFSDKFLQYTLRLPTKYVYGLGEQRGRFLLQFNFQTRSVFNYDHSPGENINGYGTHPFYLAMEESGKSHGVLLLNSNAMDIVLTPKPALTYRVVGGILDYYVFTGPTPSQVVADYSSLVGLPIMPPYWSLGFHLCKYEYGSLEVTEQVWNRTRNAGIPFDVQWNDIDYMERRNDFTYDKEKYADLPKFVKKLHDVGMHWVPIFDPGVAACEQKGKYKPYDLGLEMDIFIKNRTGDPFVGVVWNQCGETVYPDFTNPKAIDYWVQLFKEMHKDLPFDGAWIDMNEPSNFVNGPKYGSCLDENLPYMPKIAAGDGLKTKTLCMDAIHTAGSHFDVHNLYGLAEAIATNFALKEVRSKRPFVISRSSFVGLGHFSGHWSGDINSNWDDMRKTIPEILSFSLFGVPMMGADICGFNGNTNVELCKRWSQLGAFYPFSRNHNCDNCQPQDPVYLGEEVTRAARDSLRARYSILPHLYGLFWQAAMHGHTVARPVFFEYPHDQNTYPLDEQFLWGSHIMIAPILYENVANTKAYLPEDYWYALNGTRRLDSSKKGWTTLDEDETILIRGGIVLPMHTLPDSGPITTTVLRSAPLELMVALDKHSAAEGFLYWDDGDSLNTYEEKKYSNIEFSVSNNQMKSTVNYWGYGVPVIGKITIIGVTFTPSKLYLNGNAISFKFDQSSHKMTVSASIQLQNAFTMEWQN